MLYNLVLTFESLDEILKCDYSNECYWGVLSCGTEFIMIYKVVLTFKSMDEILKCDYSKESRWVVLYCGAVYNAAQGVCYFSFESVD